MSCRAWANDPRGLFPSILIVFKRKSILFGLHGEIPHEIPLPAIILEDYAVDNLNKYYIRRALSIANQLVSSSSLMDMFGLAGMTLITNVHLVFSLVQLCLKTQVLLLFPFVCKMILRRYLVTHWFERDTENSKRVLWCTQYHIFLLQTIQHERYGPCLSGS